MKNFIQRIYCLFEKHKWKLIDEYKYEYHECEVCKTVKSDLNKHQ